jgi:hypothetical protein
MAKDPDDIFEGANDLEGTIDFLNSKIEKLTKERDQAVEFLSMRMEDLNKEGKTILDFQAVWIRQARDGIQRLQARNSELEAKLSECEKFKQGYYDEAAKAWAKLAEEDRKIKQAYTKKE